MKKFLLFLAIVAVIGGGWYFLKGKDGKEGGESESETEPEKGTVEAADPPPDIVAPGDPTGMIALYSTDEGPGLVAVEKRVAQLWKSKTAVANARADENLGANLLSGSPLNAEGVKRYKRAFQNQFAYSSDLDVPLSDNIVFISNLKAVKEAARNVTGSAGEVRNIAENVLKLLDFRGIAGLRYYVWAQDGATLRADFVDSSKVYGDTKGKPSNEVANYKKFLRDAGIWADNTLKTQGYVNDVFTEQAIADLKSAGWKFTDA